MPEAFLHLDQIYLITDHGMIIKIIITFLFVSLAGYLLWLVIKRFDFVLDKVRRFQTIAIQIVFAIWIFFILCIPGWVNQSSIDNTKFFGLPNSSPEIAFVSAIKQFYFRSYKQKTFELPDDLINYISNYYGIFYMKQTEYPLVKNWIYQTPIPFKKVSNNLRKPNVIIFFIESLSSNLVGSYNSKIKTPNIDSFGRESVIIEDYYNHTFPTISGIRGQLCSFYPTLGEIEHSEEEGMAIKLYCLPHVLNRHGYSTSFFLYSQALYKPLAYTINMKKLIEACGFANVYTAEDILTRLAGSNQSDRIKRSKSVVSDLGMMVDLVNYLKGYKNKQPFFIALSTVGTHMQVTDDIDNINRSLHNLDEAFGVFWSYFKQSPFYENTIVVVTADHASPPTVQYKKFIGFKNKPVSFFDKITLIIFDKRYNLPKRIKIKATSIDLVPTILQLLEINNEPNPFQGLSIFSDRKKHPFLLCTFMDKFYTYNTNDIREYSYNFDAKLYDDYNNMPADIFNDKNKQEAGIKLWFIFNNMININNKIWNRMFEQPNYNKDEKGN